MQQLRNQRAAVRPVLDQDYPCIPVELEGRMQEQKLRLIQLRPHMLEIQHGGLEQKIDLIGCGFFSQLLGVRS